MIYSSTPHFAANDSEEAQYSVAIASNRSLMGVLVVSLRVTTHETHGWNIFGTNDVGLSFYV